MEITVNTDSLFGFYQPDKFEGPDFTLEVKATDDCGNEGTASDTHVFISDDDSSDDDSGSRHMKKKRK